MNACRGCGVLEGEPGEPCGSCDAGVWVCADVGVVECDEDACTGGPGSGRYWRVVQNSTGAANWFVAEIELHDLRADGSDLTAGSAHASAGRASDRAFLAFDGNDDPGAEWSLWYSAECCDPVPLGTDWIAWDFTVATEVNRVRIRQFDEITWMYSSLVVQSSDDGVSWRDEWVASSLPADGAWGDSSRP